MKKINFEYHQGMSPKDLIVMNQEYQKKLQILKAQIEEEAYQKMVYNVNFNSSLRENSGSKSSSLVECKYKKKLKVINLLQLHLPLRLSEELRLSFLIIY